MPELNTDIPRPRRQSSVHSPPISSPIYPEHFESMLQKWDPNQNKLVIITKAGDKKLLRMTRRLTEWLICTPRFGKQDPFTVYVDAHLEHVKCFRYHEMTQVNLLIKKNLKFWTPKLLHENPRMFHLILTLGGDGTVLFTSWLFQSYVPPILSFHLGSLNFLATYPYHDHRETFKEVFEQGYRTTARMRLSCTIYRHQQDNSACERRRQSESILQACQLAHIETTWMKKQLKIESRNLSEPERDAVSKEIPCYTAAPCATYDVLNEIVVDRGPSAYMSVLELFGDERHLTTVQADGIVIATPTGSTAYSLSAGGSLTHPEVRATLVTPICPHTLSFRPMLLPETMVIRVVVPFGSVRSAYCSFDGRNRVELKPGDHVKITVSQNPLTTVARTGSTCDWFHSLQTSLQWNVRMRQKSFLVLEEDDKKTPAVASSPTKEDLPGHEEGLFGCLHNGKQQKQSNNGTDSSSTSTTANNSETTTAYNSEDEDEDDDLVVLPEWSIEELQPPNPFAKCVKE
ncbi:atp-nad kinase [Lichtheimia corymbifera JMRC:FSU:9682]|uniref:Atp-nad kinase n=1 Tax=Lichtheimia corymbifera JMRC:FSU:9682 TaxID=1263082 RepID=A0A068S7L5_9FUNG|nr:atp-nad kinase [Lichtheimia corymbifera JMRC:FSU:9682]